MSYIYTKLVINGSEVVYSTSNPVKPNKLMLSIDKPATLDLSEGPGRNPIPALALFSSVEVWLDRANTNKCAFRGRIYSLSSNYANGFTHLYTCIGLDAEVDRLPITPEYVFNAERNTPEWNASLAGQSVGKIIKRVLEDRTADLESLGFDLSNLNDFVTKLTVTPVNTDIRVYGERLWTWVRSFVDQWCPRYSVAIEYTNTGARFTLIDRTDPADALSLKIGQDLVEPPNFSISLDGCATRVVVRGAEQVEPRELSLGKSTLAQDWTTSEENAWKLTDFTDANEAQDTGAIVSVSGDTITINPDSNTKTWPADYWSGERQGWIMMEADVITGITSYAWREIVSNTSLTANGNSVLTLGEPAPATGYTKYKIIGNLLKREHVWRKYKPAQSTYDGKLRTKFPKPVTYMFANGSAALTGQEWPMGFLLHPDTDHRYQEPCYIDQGANRIWFSNPIVTHAALGNTTTQLNAGTVNTQPNDILFFVPVALGFLEVAYPANSGGNPVFSGLAKDWYNLEKTKYVLIPDWTDKSRESKMIQLAEQTHKLVSSPVVSGNVALLGLRSHECLPPGRKLSIGAKRGAGGSEIDLGHIADAKLVIHDVTIDWSGPSLMRTTLTVSTANNGSENLEVYRHGLDGAGQVGFFAIPGLPAEGFNPFHGANSNDGSAEEN